MLKQYVPQLEVLQPWLCLTLYNLFLDPLKTICFRSPSNFKPSLNTFHVKRVLSSAVGAGNVGDVALQIFFLAKLTRFEQIWLDLRKLGQKWLRLMQIWLDLGKIKILHLQKHSISYTAMVLLKLNLLYTAVSNLDLCFQRTHWAFCWIVNIFHTLLQTYVLMENYCQKFQNFTLCGFWVIKFLNVFKTYNYGYPELSTFFILCCKLMS